MGPEGTAQSGSLVTAWGPGKDRGEGKVPLPMSCGALPSFPTRLPLGLGGKNCQGQGRKLSFGLPRPRPVWPGSTPTAGEAAQSPVVPCRSYAEKWVVFTACIHSWIYTTGDYFYRNSFTMTLFLTKGKSC